MPPPNDNKSETFRETSRNPQIYLHYLPPINLDGYWAFYSSVQEGLNPLREFHLINFKFDPTKLLFETIKKTTHEKLNDKVISNYLSITPKNVSNFNEDVDLHLVADPYSQKRHPGIKLYKKDTDHLNPRFNMPRKRKKKKKNPDLNWLNPYLAARSKNRLENSLHKMFHDLPRF